MWTTASAKALRWESVVRNRRRIRCLCGRGYVCACVVQRAGRQTAVGNEVRRITERPQCAGL